eukprot:TRINITY_DN19274_c0_g1_i1.p1 TRINITY_DN19274_c0_g1~~TRINITY_DN19274_c0_g1_i1.p1  ORF type:complete len:353 (+),score=40.76 TRINITY_DN19274_c0_g1_i1:53-1111(+)
MSNDGLSIVAVYDDLTRKGSLFHQSLDQCEEKFLRFVNETEARRARWEQSELQCQSLVLELAKATQTIGTLEAKLSQSRTMLDNELKVRRKAESERDKLSAQLALLRQLVMDDNLVDEAKLSKLKSVGYMDLDPDGAAATSVATPKGILKNVDQTDDLSVMDIEDFSFDDTADLCESRSRLERSRERKRSRSAGRDVDGSERILESVASPRRDEYQLRKRSKRSRSVVAFDLDAGGVSSSDDMDLRPTTSSLQNKNILDVYSPVDKATGHNFLSKPIMKPEKCPVCDKRIRFGRLGNKCSTCNLVVHSECSEKVKKPCTRPYPPASPVSRTPTGERGRTPVKGAYFASPMLR